MIKTRNKKGLEMAFGTIVVIILSLVVLIFLIMALKGSFKDFRDKIGIYFSDSNVDSIIDNCNSLAMRDSSYEYCCVKKEIKLSSKNKVFLTCDNARNESWGSSIDLLNCEGVC